MIHYLGGCWMCHGITLRFTCARHSKYAKVKAQLVPCPRPLFWESWSSLCPTLFEGHDKSSSTATLFNAQLGTLFSRMGIRFCSLLADFSFFKYVFQSGRFAGSNELVVPILCKTNQNQRTASSSSWKES